MVGSGSLLAAGHGVGEITPFCRYSTASSCQWSLVCGLTGRSGSEMESTKPTYYIQEAEA